MRTPDEIKEYQRQYREDHQQELKNYRFRNREKTNEYTRSKYRESVEVDPKYNRRRNLSKFGLTLEEYDKMFNAQNGLCAVCDQPGQDKRAGWAELHIDHDDAKGKKDGRRLLLCSNCNTALGLFKENITNLENAIAYLEYFKVKE